MSLLASRIQSARRTRLAAATLAALPLLAGAARAGQVTMTLNGKVVAIAHSGNPNAELDLAAQGVNIGTPVSLKVVVEDTTPAVPVVVTPTYTYQQYDMAVVDLVLSAGTWQAHFAPPAGLEATNFAKVNANSDYLEKFDGWSCTALGVDTNNILSQGSTQPPYGTFYLHCTNSPPVPGATDALVQDLKKYKTESTLLFLGKGGTLNVSFATPPAGLEAALARSGQLKAAGKLGKSVLGGLGKYAAAPDKDPLGVKKDATLQKASDTFGTQFIAAISKAAQKGGSAPLGSSDKQAATDYLMTGLQSQSDAITAQEDTSNAINRAMFGRIVKAAAAGCSAEFKAEAKDVLGPNLAKLTNALNKARAKLKKSVTAATDAALKKGVVYNGPSPDGISAALDSFVQAFVDMTSVGID